MSTWRLAVGERFVYDGRTCTVVAMDASAIVLRSGDGSLRRVRVVDALRPAGEGGLVGGFRGVDADEEVRTVLWADSAAAADQEAAHQRADDVREVLTGFRSGSADVPREGEPRHAYAAGSRMQARVAAKARDLGVTERTVQRWVSAYREGGEVALLDGRSATRGRPLSGVDPRWVAVAAQVLDEHTAESKVAKRVVLERIQARLERTHGVDVVPLPSQTTAYAALTELGRGRGTFGGPTKAKRSIGNRPAAPYGRLVAARPGEFVLLDTTPLNVFAIAPVKSRGTCAFRPSMALDEVVFAVDDASAWAGVCRRWHFPAGLAVLPREVGQPCDG